MKGSGKGYWFLRKCGAFLRRDLLFETSYKLHSLFRALTILFKVLTFYFLSRFVGGDVSREHLGIYGEDYFSFALVGLSFSGVFNAGLTAFTTSLRQQMTMGVFEIMSAAPIRAISLLLYSLLWPVGFELVKALFYLLVGTLFLGARIGVVDAPLLAATVMLCALVFGSMGAVAGSLILYFKRGDPIAWLLSSATELVGGVLFPITLLPGSLQVVAHLTPVPYALNLLRAALIPAAQLTTLRTDLVALVAFGAILVPVAIGTCHVVVSSARSEGSLGHF